MVVSIASDSEFKQTIGKPSLTVVDWYADWCGPCKAIAPEFERMSKEFSGCQFIKVNVDNFPDLSQEHAVRAMPTFMLFKGGKKIDEVVGADVRKLRSLIDKHKGPGGMSASGGRVLGTGKPAAPQAASAGSQAQTNNVLFYAILGLFIAYLYFNKE